MTHALVTGGSFGFSFGKLLGIVTVCSMRNLRPSAQEIDRGEENNRQHNQQCSDGDK